jgi:cathepsin D
MVSSTSTSSLLLPLALLVSLSANVIAAPHPTIRSSLSMNLKRRNVAPQSRSQDDIAAWASAHRAGVQAKYGNPSALQKRDSGENQIVNQNGDASFFGSIAVGTPPVAYDVILDTGSSDLWLAGSNCVSNACDGIATFKSSSSSTFKNTSEPFQITYGSGEAAGVLGQDAVQMAGFSVSNQVFAVCDDVSSGLLNAPVSGLLGLAFQTIASSQASPLWETLASSGSWDEPLMAFQLTRYNNDTQTQSLLEDPSATEVVNYGGTFTMGATNSSLFTGEIDYNPLPDSGSYWLQTISSITSQGSAITISSGSSALAAIDTGTTLVGGPEAEIAAIYANIPGSAPGTGQFEGYYTYPCSTTVNVTMAFGGKSWPVSNTDFQAQTLSKTSCLGAFFSLSTGGNAPAWIVGDTFLKNVYSVYRYNPPAVGFAQLSSTALGLSGNNDLAVPSPTTGAAATVIASSGSSSSHKSNSNGAGSTFASSSSLSSALSLPILVIAMTMLFYPL